MFDLEEKDRQPELFGDLPLSAKRAQRKKFILGRMTMSISYENIFISAIGLIILFIVCYSLGIERGKQLVKLGVKDIAVEEEQVQTLPKPQPAQPQKKLNVELAQPQKVPGPLAYIQVASFLTDKYAQKEIARLRHKGYQPYALTRGKYRVVYVGNYANNAQAVKDLTDLRKIYADCILRHR